MIKHLFALILLSLAIVFGMHFAAIGVNALVDAHNWISETLKNVFSAGQAGNFSRELIALLAIPLLVGLTPAIIYWFAKRKWLPCFMELVWVVWLVQTSAIVVLSKAAVVG